MLLVCFDRGAEAISSAVEVPSSFGGPVKGAQSVSAKSPGEHTRPRWGVRTTPAHCHPNSREIRMERYRRLGGSPLFSPLQRPIH